MLKTDNKYADKEVIVLRPFLLNGKVVKKGNGKVTLPFHLANELHTANKVTFDLSYKLKEKEKEVKK